MLTVEAISVSVSGGISITLFTAAIYDSTFRLSYQYIFIRTDVPLHGDAAFVLQVQIEILLGLAIGVSSQLWIGKLHSSWSCWLSVDFSYLSFVYSCWYSWVLLFVETCGHTLLGLLSFCL